MEQIYLLYVTISYFPPKRLVAFGIFYLFDLQNGVTTLGKQRAFWFMFQGVLLTVC